MTGSQVVVHALRPLTGPQRRFVLAYTDPREPTFHNGTQSALAAGSTERSAPSTASKWLKLAKVRKAIEARLRRVQQILDVDRSEYVLRVFEQADAWKDDNGRPLVRRRRYFHEGEELACDEEQLIPGMAQYRALELSGRLLGHVRDEPGLPAGTVFVVAMPVKPETAEEWFESYGRALQSRDYTLPPVREVGRS